MLNFILDYGLFFLEAVTIVVAILICLSGVIGIIAKSKLKPKEKISIRKLNEKYQDMGDAIREGTCDKKELKAIMKKRKQEEKKKQQDLKKGKNKEKSQKRIFVLNFNGDIKASAVANLREEITAILTAVMPSDEVLVKIESSGGTIHDYGLAASQLKRIKDQKIPLTIAVDKVAASGGYMMACVADRILAAPFAVLGSIGVVAQLPNFNRLLKKHDVAFEQITAGEYKRTLSLFGENTAKGRKKMQEEVEEAHELFKKFVSAQRPKVAIEKISTGEHWYGTRALELKLVDEIMTSDDYLLSNSAKAGIYEITYSIKKNLLEKFGFELKKGLISLRSI